MKLTRGICILFCAVLILAMIPAAGLAGRNATIDAADVDFAAVIEDTSAEGTANVYHWWTAGGEKQAIESIINGFTDIYTSIEAKSNAIPGGAGGAMVMKVEGAPAGW